MILKIQGEKQGKEKNVFYEEWTFIDNISSASAYYDDAIESTAVRCCFRDESVVTIPICHVAYLMSDAGKTVDRFSCAASGRRVEDDVYPTLDEAIEEARKRSLEEAD